MGRGLSALIATGDSVGGLKFEELPISAIRPNSNQPRQSFPEAGIKELAASIREVGILQPLVVRTTADGFELIAGERRLRAASEAGLDRVPVLIRQAGENESVELALVENLQRADLNPLEEAGAYRSLMDEFGMKHEEIAARVGKSRQAVVNSLRLLKLPPAVQESLALELITEGHARAILQAPTEEEQLRLMESTVAEGLSVRQVEELARLLADRAGRVEQREEEPALAGAPAPTPDASLYDEVRALEDRFRDALGTKVQLSRSRRGGKLVIFFYSEEELDRIYGAIVREEEA